MLLAAAVPLDFTAKAPPVQFSELYPLDFDNAKLRATQAKCQAAWVGSPAEKRMHLQWIRVTMAINEADLRLLTPQVRALADDGSAEAQYLLYVLHFRNPEAAESSMMDVSREEGWANLNKAAEAGHMDAIDELIRHYRGQSVTIGEVLGIVEMVRPKGQCLRRPVPRDLQHELAANRLREGRAAVGGDHESPRTADQQLGELLFEIAGALAAGAVVTEHREPVDPDPGSGRRRARFLRVTSAGLQEGHVHDVIITKEAPNYRIE